MAEFHYGGQAVMEGVMMRGQRHMAVAVRDPQGTIVTHREPLTAFIYTHPIGRLPLVRGLAMLWDTLGLGLRALMFSADVALGEEDVEFSGPIAWGTVAVSLAAGVGIFLLLPSAVAKLLDQYVSSPLANSMIEGLIRLALFLAYVYAIGLLPDIRRVFAYHGAEHMTINAYEAGVSLDPAHIRTHSTAHTRCGTSFLLVVLVLSILIFAPFHFSQWTWRLLSRVVLIPLVAGLAYEFIKFSANHQHSPFLRWAIAPGLVLQRLTTRQPDDSMLEVAIVALEEVLAADAVTPDTPQAAS